MTLPALDREFLERREFDHDVTSDGSMICVVVKDWQMPSGLNVESADLLLRIQPGYPDLPPDMWWFTPAITLANGATIPATEVTEHHLGRQWQRWSRHFALGQWSSGVDGLESYIALIERELQQSAASSV